MADRLVNPNPAMTKGFEQAGRGFSTSRMTLAGTINAAVVLTLTTLAAGAVGWLYLPTGLAIVAVLVAFVIGLVTTFKPHLAPKTAFVYSGLMGLGVGAISALYNDQYDGIVGQALGLTVAILVVLLAIYRTGAIKPSANFKLGVAAATGGIALFYLATIGLGFFGIEMPVVNSNSNFGILFSLLVVALASANLVVDFDFIEEGVERGAPKYMEWYGAFGLMVTLIWLYLELLRLLAKLRSR